MEQNGELLETDEADTRRAPSAAVTLRTAGAAGGGGSRGRKGVAPPEVTALTGAQAELAFRPPGPRPPHSPGGWFTDHETRAEDIGGLDQGHAAGTGQNHVRTRGA